MQEGILPSSPRLQHSISKPGGHCQGIKALDQISYTQRRAISVTILPTLFIKEVHPSKNTRISENADTLQNNSDINLRQLKLLNTRVL